MYCSALFDRIVATPLILSFSMAKMGDLAKPSNRLISLEDVTKIVLVLKKYHIRGGSISKM